MKGCGIVVGMTTRAVEKLAGLYLMQRALLAALTPGTPQNAVARAAADGRLRPVLPPPAPEASDERPVSDGA